MNDPGTNVLFNIDQVNVAESEAMCKRDLSTWERNGLGALCNQKTIPSGAIKSHGSMAQTLSNSMNESIFRSGRSFTLWDVNPTHIRVLIRSAPERAQGQDQNIDLQFQLVTYMDIPSMFSGISIRAASNDEREKVIGRLPKSFPDYKVFVIESSGIEYHIVALSLWVEENTLSPMESSILNNFTKDV